EKDSIAVVALSSDINQTSLPANWSSDKERNQYYMGLFSASRAGGSQEQDFHAKASCQPEEDSASRANDVPEFVTRFIRSSRVESQQLMARIRLDDGTVVTTYSSTPAGSFNSSIT